MNSIRIFVDPNNAPLRDVPAAMQPRRLAEIQKMLTESGVTLQDGKNEDGSLNVSLRNLDPRNRGAIVTALESIGVCRVDLEPADLERLNGKADVFTHSAARGIESGVEAITSLTSQLAVDEIFDAVSKAGNAVLRDRTSPEVLELLRPQVEIDLIAAGLIDGNHRSMEDYDGTIRNNHEPPPRSGEFAEDAALPYRSPFAEEF